MVATRKSIIGADSTQTAHTEVLRDSAGRARFADPSNAQDAATKNYVDTSAPDTYAGTDVTTATGVGGVIAQGALLALPVPGPLTGTTNDLPPIGTAPGYASMNPDIPGLLDTPSVAFFGADATTLTVSAGSPPPVIRSWLSRGMRFKVKGRYTARSDTPYLTDFERFGVALVAHTGGSQGNGLASTAANPFSETENVRDDFNAMGFSVNDLEGVKTFNTAAAGDASYSDPPGGALTVDLTAGVYFEVTVEIPGTALDFANYIVSMTINGTTLFSSVNPLGVSGNGDQLLITGLFNQDAYYDKLSYKVERVA